MCTRIGTLDPAPADALWSHDRDPARQPCPGMQRPAEAIGGRWRYVILQVGRLLREIAARERAQLRRLYAHRPAPRQHVVGTHGVAPDRARDPLVQRDGVLDLVGEADLPVVLHVLADAG